MQKKLVILASVFVGIVVITAPLTTKLPIKLIYNSSPSAPIGFYQITSADSLKRRTFALVPTPGFRILAAQRNYIPINIPLIKRVVALPGDEVCRLKTRILINNETVAEALLIDNQGRPLPIWQGCITLDDTQFFALMDSPDSFDGGYFGPLNISNINGIATPIAILDVVPN